MRTSLARFHVVTLALAAGAVVVAAGVSTACGGTSSTTAEPAPQAETPEVDGGDGDAGPSADGPLTTTAATWVWNPIVGSECGNGSETGIGVNLGTSDRVVVYFEGGGACWNGLTCFSAKTAQNIETGFGEAEFTSAVSASRTTNSIFDRSAAANVFKDDTYVYIPYCTGDVHSGAKVTTYDDGTAVHHMGRVNAEKIVARLGTTFKAKAARVFVTGSSAGGFGAAINYWRFAETFAPARVDLVDDSGPPFPASRSVYLQQWNGSWDLFGAFPKDCTSCANDPANVVPYYSAKYPGSRFALLSYDHDGTISKFYGMSGDEFKVAIEEVAAGPFGQLPNGRYFYVPGTSHTMLRALSTSSGGTTLGSWLTAMVTDSADWKSVAVAK